MRFSGFKWSVAKIVIAVVLGLLTFWPQYGVIFLATENAQSHPILVSTFVPIWVILLALILPLPLRWFSRITTFAWIIVIFGIDISAYQHQLIDPTSLTFYLTYGVIEVFGIIGWMMCTSQLWRIFHGIVAVQQTPEEEHHQA